MVAVAILRRRFLWLLVDRRKLRLWPVSRPSALRAASPVAAGSEEARVLGPQSMSVTPLPETSSSS